MRRETIMRLLHHTPEAGLPDLDETGGEALDINSDFSNIVMIIKKHLQQNDHPLKEILSRFEHYFWIEYSVHLLNQQQRKDLLSQKESQGAYVQKITRKAITEV